MNSKHIFVFFSITVIMGCATEPKKRIWDEPHTSISFEYLSDGTNYRRNPHRSSNVTYRLLPMDGGAFDLKTIKVGKEFKRILKASGMDESDNPDMIVFFSFKYDGVSSKEQSIPYAIKGQTGISSATTTGTVIGGNVHMRTTVIPTYGTTGYGEHKYTTYSDTYTISMVALDAVGYKTGKPKQLWTVTAASSGTLLNEELNLKALLMSIKDNIGGSRDHSSKSKFLTKEQIVNPAPYNDLDVDGITEGANATIKQLNATAALHAPQPYSNKNINQELIKKINNWNVFCQKKDGEITGCGMTDAGITIFIERKNYDSSILIGSNESLSPGSDVCLELDGNNTCLKVGAREPNTPDVGYKVFKGDLFWKLEKAQLVKVAYLSDKEKNSRIENIDMSHYSDALETLRRSLP